jgi:hypothetical protein
MEPYRYFTEKENVIRPVNSIVERVSLIRINT